MKTHFSFFILLLSFFVGNSQIINIPDANFKAKLISAGIDTNNDGEIQQNEALTTTALYIASANITSLEGLSYFSNLTTLSCYNNPLTEINLCGTAVWNLLCWNCPNLAYINVKNNVISHYIIIEPPYPPFWADNLPALQNVCCDAGELEVAQESFTTPNVTFTTDCDISACTALLHAEDPIQELAMTMYPNPVNDKLTISLAENTTLKSISIYNTLGQLVQVNTNPNDSIDVSALKTGNYFIKIVSNKGTTTENFIKE